MRTRRIGAERAGGEQGFLTLAAPACPELVWRRHQHPLTPVPPTCATTLIGQVRQRVEMGSTPDAPPPQVRAECRVAGD